MKIIKFFRIPYRYIIQNGIKVRVGEIAFNEEDLFEKLGKDNMAEIHIPAKAWYVQLWRKFFPLKGIEMR